MIWHLAPNGRIGMVLANGSLSSQSGGEGEIRKNIINADLVDCIVAMPTQLFYTTQIPVSLWFLAKNKKQKGKTLFIDARKLGTMVTRKLRELTDIDIKKIADTYNAFVEGTFEDEKASALLLQHRTSQNRTTFSRRDGMLALRNKRMTVSRLKRKWGV